MRALHEQHEWTFRGQRFVFRVPHLGDYVKLDLAFPIPPAEAEELRGKSGDETMAFMLATPQRQERFIERYTRLLAIVAVEPRFADSERGEVPEGAFDVRGLPAEKVISVGVALAALSGVDDGEVVTLRPLSAGAPTGPPSNSTPSPGATEATRATSSSAGRGAD